MAKSTKQIQEDITNQIVNSLSSGVMPWRKPWSTSPNCGAPTNFVSGNRYRGINPLLLSLHQDKHGFNSKWYATFRQWDELGAKVLRRPENVRPGDWGCSVIYYAQISRTKIDESGEEVEDRFPLLKQYSVFNAEQVELPTNLQHLIDTSEPGTNAFVDYSPAECAIHATKADIRHGGNKCFYSPSCDFIQIVPKHQFHSEREYYAAVLHELAHWSEKRCDWLGNYAMGELRAELAASFICAELGIPNSDDLTNVKAYLQSWLTALKNDPKYIFQASTAAAKATDFVLSFSRQPVEAVA